MLFPIVYVFLVFLQKYQQVFSKTSKKHETTTKTARYKKILPRLLSVYLLIVGSILVFTCSSENHFFFFSYRTPCLCNSNMAADKGSLRDEFFETAIPQYDFEMLVLWMSSSHATHLLRLSCKNGYSSKNASRFLKKNWCNI